MGRKKTTFQAKLFRYPGPGGWTFALVPDDARAACHARVGVHNRPDQTDVCGDARREHLGERAQRTSREEPRPPTCYVSLTLRCPASIAFHAVAKATATNKAPVSK